MTTEEATCYDATPLHEAFGVLAGVCDYAQAADGQGFNGTDTYLGHALAAMPPVAWDEDTALAAWDMLRKYRRQLGGFGVDYDNLPVPPGADELAAERRRAREAAREAASRWRRQQQRRQRSYVRCEGEGQQVTLAFPYEPDMVDAARRIDGREYDPGTKSSRYPFTSLGDVVALADEHGIDVPPETRALAALADAEAERRAAWEAAKPNVYLDAAGRVVIEALYSAELNGALKALNNGHSTWDKAARVHRPPLHADPTAILELAVEHKLKVAPEVHVAIEGELDRQVVNQCEAGLISGDAMEIPGLAPGRSLKPQQYPVVRFVKRNKWVLIGDNMGWGKTLSSLASCAVEGAFPVVIVCRPSLTLTWADEIKTFFPGWHVHIATGTNPTEIPRGVQAVIIGSAALAAYRGTKANKWFPWVAKLTALKPRAVIVDEGQDAKESTANRSQAIEQLAAPVVERHGLVMDLTGTAIVNRPRELCQQLVILGRIEEFGGPKAFLQRYCVSEAGEHGAKYNGRHHLDELHDRLIAWGIMIRRSDDDALGLPPLRQHVLTIPDGALGAAAMERYRAAERDVVTFLADRAAKIAEELGENPRSARVRAAMAAMAAEHLVQINTLRGLIGEAKIPAIEQWVADQVRRGEKVMIAAHHRKVVNTLAKRFGGLTIQGGQSVEDKQADKARFQTWPVQQAPVIVVGITAGGVGHTLTAARIGVQAECPWTPGDKTQMMKRLHRIGQARPVDYFRAIAPGTIDDYMDEVVAEKQSVLDLVLDGKSAEGTDEGERAAAADVAWMLAERGFAARG